MASDYVKKKRRMDYMLDYLTELNEKEPERFNLGSWIWADASENLVEAQETWKRRYNKGKPLNCGTTACVMGHMPIPFPGAFKWVDDDVVYIPKDKAEYNDPVRYSKADQMAHFFGGGAVDWIRIMFPVHYEDYEDRNIPLSEVLGRLEELFEKLYGGIEA